MRRYEQFAYCPCCGHKYGDDDFFPGDVAFYCRRCGFVFYQNCVPAATAVIPVKSSPDRILLLTRATEPAGKLALPGGFLRYGEDPAECARREAQEETVLDVTIDRLLCVYLLEYTYLGTKMSILELSFLANPVEADVAGIQTEEASALEFYKTDRSLDEAYLFAFPEQLAALRSYQELVCSEGLN
ncbi:MAG TPA: NUDIX domain-containing protein [Terriglobia bacterium]|nr:NUDIX domain-containing protein [Terriglobia bacterium]